MKVLYIGGTGNISTASSKLAVEQGIDLYLLNRGNRKVDIPGAKTITADIYDTEQTKSALKDHEWDVVVNWISFTPEHIQNDLELFRGKTKQYIFISTASAYQKPPTFPLITESTPLYNPYWEYSSNKIACEDALMSAYRDFDFPITIVRPSHTYETVIPVTIGGWTEFTVVDRMRKGQKVIIQGDGTSLWTITHSKDFAKGFNGLLGNQRTIGHAFHITSDEWLTWNQIYQCVADAAGAELNAIHIATDFIDKIAPGEKDGLWGDKAHCGIFDNSKIKSFVPDYCATIPFSEGIKDTIAWFEAEADRMIVNESTNAMMDRILNAYGELGQ
jgi:nucleoside-diphosphate-sugar epimerase